jgi:precorrin-2 dehydrogenase / sirohydrochlorin ferrochelatase
MKYYPICLDIKGKKCLVVGGGRVARRKTCGLLEQGADITLISPDIIPELCALSEEKKIIWKKRGYCSGDTAGFFLIIAATDDKEVQKQVYKEAQEAELLINVADVPDLCNFILPANVVRGDLNISISTGGKSPALARKLRIDLEEQFGDEYRILVDILGKIRSEVLAMGKTQTENKQIFEKIIQSNLLSLIKTDDLNGIEECLSKIIEN